MGTDDTIKKAQDWDSANIRVFWGEASPYHHSVQIYETDKSFYDTLEGFAGCGFISGDSIIMIATPEHIKVLNERLRRQGFKIDALIEDDRYIIVDADEALSEFMVNNKPDEKLFKLTVKKLLARAGKNGRKVRAFGEMVALLWQRGYAAATVKLENLWHQLQKNESFTIFCAYPKATFTQNPTESIRAICKNHSRIIDGVQRPTTEIYYKNLVAGKG